MPTEDEIETTEEAETEWGIGEGSGGDGVTGAQPRPGEPLAPEASVAAIDDLLDQVEEALSRLDDGTYGRCASCGGSIDDARLADDPTARQCAGCQSPTDG